MNGQDRWLILSAVFFALLGMVGAIFGLISLVKAFAPQVLAPHPTGFIELFLGICFLLMAILAGTTIGSVFFILIWRPFVPRQKLKMYVTQPEIPLISSLLLGLFDRIYPENQSDDSSF